MTQFGINVNNREPLIAPEYDLGMLLDLAAFVEECGFASVWVGDSLFSKPRYEPIALLAAISQRTKQVRLGTSCMVSSTRNPLYLALEWATLDCLSGGRTILGTGVGNPEEGVRREFEALGLDYAQRGEIFEEGLAVLRALWTEGVVSYPGNHFRLRQSRLLLRHGDGPSDADTEAASDLGGLEPAPQGKRTDRSRSSPIEEDLRPDRPYGDGWMTCCRAQHPEELDPATRVDSRSRERSCRRTSTRSSSRTKRRCTSAAPRADARRGLGEYIGKYYPELSQSMDLSNWGPVGTPEQIITGFEPSPMPASTISSAVSARSTNSARSNASRPRYCRGSQPRPAAGGVSMSPDRSGFAAGRRANVKEVVQPVGSHHPQGAWSQGVRIGQLLFVSGQVGEDEDGVITHPDDMAIQATMALEQSRSSSRGRRWQPCRRGQGYGVHHQTRGLSRIRPGSPGLLRRRLPRKHHRRSRNSSIRIT